jgi:hypothetical protein
LGVIGFYLLVQSFHHGCTCRELQGYYPWVENLLERGEAALSKLSLLPAMLNTTHVSCPPDEAGVGFTEDREA